MLQFRRPEPFLVFVLIAIFSLLAGLGAWQLQRLAWKENILAQIKQTEQQAPLAQWPAENSEAIVFRHVKMKGQFAYSHTVFRPTAMPGGKNGYQLLVPFKPMKGDEYILVNRGFMNGPIEAIRAGLPETNKEVTTIEGVLRQPREKRFFMPENHNEKRIWLYEDLAWLQTDLAAKLAPLVIEETGDCGNCTLIKSDGKIFLRNDHLGYALTWFALAFISVIMFAAYHVKKPEDAR